MTILIAILLLPVLILADLAKRSWQRYNQIKNAVPGGETRQKGRMT